MCKYVNIYIFTHIHVGPVSGAPPEMVMVLFVSGYIQDETIMSVSNMYIQDICIYTHYIHIFIYLHVG